MLPVFIALLCCTCLFVTVAPAQAGVTALVINKREPYDNGAAQGDRGAYERLSGIARFALDPSLPANANIVDLKFAPRNAAGFVECWADVQILLPADRSKANGTLFYDVNNRGNYSSFGSLNEPGKQFLLHEGFIVVGSGWIGETLPDSGRTFRFGAPVAREEDGKPIRGMVRQEFSDDQPETKVGVALRGRMGSHRPSERGIKEATLTMRERESDQRQRLPRDQWNLVITEVPHEGSNWPLPLIEVEVPAGLKPGWIYELIYEAQDPIVQGAGLAAMRDLVSFLRYDTSEQNPLRDEAGKPMAQRTIAFGTSQSGRCLRQFLYDGFNADERGRIVFDGVMPHVAGGGRGSFNHRFASPNRSSGQHSEHLFPIDVFPFTYGDSTDPFTGRADGILRRSRQQGVVPKVIHTQTSNEYWGRAGSLAHTDPAGKSDAEIPAEVRIYTFGGAQHGSGNGIPAARADGTLPYSPTNYRPLTRALVTAMDAWLRDGREPPASVYPRISDGTLVDMATSVKSFPAIPGVTLPTIMHLPAFANRGPDWDRSGVASIEPPEVKGHYGALVPAVDSDGNDRGTVLVPPVAVPVATFTAWNLRPDGAGAAGQLLALRGGYIPFPRTLQERTTTNDPRPALSERYQGFADYQKKYDAAARKLVKQRFLLEADLPGLRELCERSRELLNEDAPGK